MTEELKKHLVLTAVGRDRPGIVNELSKSIVDTSCNIEDSRMTVLGGEFAVLLLITGAWNAVAKLEHLIPQIEKRLEFTITARYTEPRTRQGSMVPYVVDVISMDHPGIVHEIAAFFSAREINIEDLNTWTYPAAHTGTSMFSMSMTIAIPSEVHIGRLRQEFTEFCDDLNLDATLEPSRN